MKVRIEYDAPYDSSCTDIDATRYSFPFSVSHLQPGALRDIDSEHRIDVEISGHLALMWSNHVGQSSLPRVLFEYARREVLRLLERDELVEDQQITLYTDNSPDVPEYDPDKIPEPNGHIEEHDLSSIRERLELVEKETRRIGF